GADGADLAAHAVGAFLERQRVQLLPAGALPGRDQRRIRNRGDSALACKRLRPGAAEKNMGRVVADAARGEDGVLHRLHAGDGTTSGRVPAPPWTTTAGPPLRSSRVSNSACVRSPA